MTNKLSTERAIEALYTVRAYYASLTAGYPKGKDRRGIGDVMCSEIANSCLMAIEALEQQQNRCDSCVHSEEQDGSNCYECVKGMADNFELMRDATEEERKSVKDYVESISKPTGVHFDEAQPKTGHWIKMGDGFTPYECSECEKIEFKKSNYCPNCGAKMEVEE